MNLTLSDINGALLAMAQNTSPGAGAMTRQGAGFSSEKFLDRIKAAMAENGTGNAGLCEEDGLGTQCFSVLEQSLEQGDGMAFLVEVKKLLLAVSDQTLDNLSLDEQGLGALEELLVNAGFDPAAVQDLMAEFSLEIEENDGALPLSQVMDRLFELPRDTEEDTAPEVLLPTSDIPYIQSILTTLGLDQSSIDKLISTASRGTQGISLDTLVSELKQLADSSPDGGSALQSPEGDTGYLLLFQQLGLGVPEQAQAGLTLNELIRALEQKQADLMPQAEAGVSANTTEPQGSQASIQELLSKFFSSLETKASTPPAQETAGVDTAAAQIRDQVKNDIFSQLGREGSENPILAREKDDKVLPVFNTQAGLQGAGDTNPDLARVMEKAQALADGVKTTPASGADAVAAAAASEAGEKTNTVLPQGSSHRAGHTLNSLPAHVTNQVGKGLLRAMDLGENTLRIQLKPPELGRVFMTIDNSGDAMKVSIITEHQSARDILASNAGEIKTLLSSSGISLEKFEVDLSQDFRQSMADARGQDQSNRKKQGRQFPGSDKLDDTGLTTSPIQSGGAEQGASLHYVA